MLIKLMNYMKGPLKIHIIKKCCSSQKKKKKIVNKIDGERGTFQAKLCCNF